MSSGNKSGDSNPNSPAIDPNFLDQCGEFEVLDVWEQEGNAETSSSGKIKKEKEDPVESRSKNKEVRDTRKRTSSDTRGGHGSTQRSASRERVRNRNNSPARRRSPSPPARRPQKSSFLDDLKKQFETEGKDSSFLDNVNVSINNNNSSRQTSESQSRNQIRNRNNQRRQMEQQIFMQQQQQQNAMNNYNYNQQQQQYMMPSMMPMMPFQQFNPIGPQMGYDMYGNPMMQPQSLMMMPNPEPVPAPIPTQTMITPPGVLPHFNPQFNNDPPAPQVEVTKSKPSKALDNGGINLSAFLRQKSKQQSKEQANTALTALKQKVKENCKKAFELIADLENKRSIMPFTCAFTQVQSPLIRQDAQIGNRSPLVMSENNVNFQFQTPPSRCRSAFERNPLKKLHESSQLLMPLARNMKYDMLELSLKVKEQILTTDFSKEVERKEMPVVSRLNSNPNKGTQTDTVECEKCMDRFEVQRSAKNKGAQTTQVETADAGIQSSMNSEGDFNVLLTADRIANMNFQQHHAFKTFIQEFQLNYDECMPSTSNQAASIRNRLKDIGRIHLRDMPAKTRDNEEDRMNYANPENPGMNSLPGFVSFSPPRSSNSIFDRLDQRNPPEYRIPSPPHGALVLGRLTRSPPPLSRIPQSSPIFLNRSRSRSRSPSPLTQRSLTMRRNRSPDEEIGYRNRSPNGNRSQRGRYNNWSPPSRGRDRGHRGRGRY